MLNNIDINSVHLSRRELQCLTLSIRGQSARKAALQLGISQRTVEEYISNIKHKLGVKSKSEMIEAGLNLILLPKLLFNPSEIACVNNQKSADLLP